MGRQKLNNSVRAVTVSIRIRDDILFLMDYILNQTKIDKRTFIELCILEKISKFDLNFQVDGVDFKRYAEIIRLEKIRSFHGKFRNEILSRNLFMNRVRMDLFKLISAKTGIKEIKKYLGVRFKEAKNYTENTELLEEFRHYLKINRDKYSELEEEIKHKIENFSVDNLNEIADKGIKQLIGNYTNEARPKLDK